MNYIEQVYKGKNDIWRYIVSFLIIVIGWQGIGAIPLFITAVLHSKNMDEFMLAAQDNFMSLGINSNLFLSLMLLMFAIGLGFLFLSIKSIHKRSIASLITSRKKMDWKRFFYAFFIWFTISTTMLVIGYFMAPENFTWNFKLVPFLILVLISFALMPLQTTLEELFFRGYIMQGLGGLVKNKWFPLIFTSVMFGLLHGANPEVDKLGPFIMVYYIGTGLFLGMLTLLDEGNELSMGFHAANNIVAAIFVTTTWTVFQTEAILIDNSDPSLGYETFLPVFVLYPLLLLLFSKKYGWTNWKEKLFGKVYKPNTQAEEFFKEDSMLEL